MNQLKSNFPHPDRMVVGQNNLRKPGLCDESGIIHSHKAMAQDTNSPSVGSVKIGLGTERTPLNRARKSTFQHHGKHDHHADHTVNEHTLKHFSTTNNPNVTEYK